MNAFEELVEQENNTHERHGAGVRFFMSLKEPLKEETLEKEAAPKIKKVDLSDVRSATRATTKQNVSKQGVKSVPLRKLPKADLGISTKATQVAKVTGSSKKKFKKIAPPATRSVSKPKLRLPKVEKTASMQKEALIEGIVRALARGTQKGAASAKAGWKANKPWLHGFGEGISSPAETFGGKWKRRLGNIGRKLTGKAPVLSPEDVAKAKGSKFHQGWLSGKNLEETAGITRNREELMRRIRDPKTGLMNPGSVMKGLSDMGITSPEAIMRKGWDSLDYLKATKAARDAAKTQRRNMLIGGGALGLGGAYLLTRKPRKAEAEPLKVQLS